jgi:hypothetical protein
MGTIKKDLLDTLEDNVGRVDNDIHGKRMLQRVYRAFDKRRQRHGEAGYRTAVEIFLGSRYDVDKQRMLRNNLPTTSVVIPTNRIVAVCFSDL